MCQFSDRGFESCTDHFPFSRIDSIYLSHPAVSRVYFKTSSSGGTRLVLLMWKHCRRSVGLVRRACIGSSLYSMRRGAIFEIEVIRVVDCGDSSVGRTLTCKTLALSLNHQQLVFILIKCERRGKCR